MHLWKREFDWEGEKEQRIGDLDENFLISLFLAYFQLLDGRPQELFTKLKYLLSLQKSMLKDGDRNFTESFSM